MTTKRTKTKKAAAGTTTSPATKPSTLVPAPYSGFAPEAGTKPCGPLVASKLLGNEVWEFDLTGIPKGLAKTLPIAVSLGTRAYPVRQTERLHTEKFQATVTPGIATADFREFFLAKGSECNGTLQLKRRADGWVASMAKSLVPYVLTKQAVDAGVMPPEGCSALPPSLEAVVPYALRYWTLKGDDARRVRDALVSMELFAEPLVKMVDGEHRLCVSKLYLYEPTEEELAKTEFGLPDPGPTFPGYAFKCERCDEPASRALELLADAVTKRVERELVCGDCATKALVSADEPLPVVKATSVEEAFAANEDSIIGRTVTVTADTGESAVGKVLAEAMGNALVLFEDGERRMVARHRCSDPRDTATKGLLPVSLRGIPTEKAEKPADPLQKFLGRTVRFAKAKAGDEKATTEERFVYGIVLEPETVDAQQDIYSADEIRNAAHAFMEKFRTMGFMHKGAINDKVKILESFIAPVDFEVDGAPVKKGTWVMAVKVVDDELWTAVKGGDITGFSIGGSAIRKPDTGATQAA
jgi:hypothetical protein